MQHADWISAWDIGGAHLKVSRIDGQGRLLDCLSVPCPLWRGIAELERALDSVLHRLQNRADCQVVTLTGELVDAFTDRAHGVDAILSSFASRIGHTQLHVFGHKQTWHKLPLASAQWADVASMNWLATARYVASRLPNAWVIDIGSTTTDLIACVDGQVATQAVTDFDRLQERSLIYQGVVRTPVMAIAQHLPFAGQTVPVLAEWFATSADAWVLAGSLRASEIQDPAPDGRSYAPMDCEARLARSIGLDRADAQRVAWHDLARAITTCQQNRLEEAWRHQLACYPQLASAPVVTAGLGHWLADTVARRLDLPVVPFTDLLDTTAPCAATAMQIAPAVALALLAKSSLS